MSILSHLKRCREQMSSRDRLLVVERVPVPGQPDAGIAMLDMAMMMFGGEQGGVDSIVEFRPEKGNVSTGVGNTFGSAIRGWSIRHRPASPATPHVVFG